MTSVVPPVGDPRRAEVSLARLLLCCADEASSDPAWAASAAAQHASECALSLLSQLAAAGATPGPRLALLRQRTEALASSLRPAPRPAYLRAPPSGGAGGAGAGGGARLSAAQLSTTQQQQSQAHAQLLQRRRATGPSAVPASAADALLRHEAAVQEELAGEMVAMAAGLKRNALAMHQGVRASLAVLDDVDAAVERNLGAARGAVGQATALHRAGRASCWATVAVVALVALTFCGMVAFILATRDRTRR